MELRRWCIGHDVQRNVKDTGHQTLGIQAAAKALLDEQIQPGLAADLKLLIRFGLGELFVNRDNYRHGKVIAGLVMTNQHLDNFADGNASEFHRSARVQALERRIEVKDVPVPRVEKVLRTEKEQSDDGQSRTNHDEEADSSRVS